MKAILIAIVLAAAELETRAQGPPAVPPPAPGPARERSLDPFAELKGLPRTPYS